MGGVERRQSHDADWCHLSDQDPSLDSWELVDHPCEAVPQGTPLAGMPPAYPSGSPASFDRASCCG